MGFVVDKLAKLWGEEEDSIRFVVVKISKKPKLCIRELHLQQIIMHCNVIRENCFLVGIGLGVYATDNKKFQFRLSLGSNFYPDNFQALWNKNII